MKITAEKDQQSQYIVRIEIEPAELEEAKGRAAKKLSNQLRIPGFRPGKAPRALVERFVGEEGLVEQATRELLPKAYENALKQEDIKPIADPQIDIESTQPLTIVATIPVEPTVELGKYEDIRFELPPVNVTDEDVDKVIEQLVDQQSTWEEPEEARAAQDGDQVELEVQTLRDGEPVGEATPRTGVLGKGELLSQMDEQVQGMNVGEEKVIEIKRQTPAKPAETTSEETAAEGAEATETETPELPEVETIPLDEEEEAPMTFRVKLNSVKVKHEPELNDEFAQSVSDVQTVDELKDRVRKNLVEQRETNNKRELTEKIVKEAVGVSTVVMPPVMVDAEIHAMEDNMANRLKQQKLTLDQYLQFMGKDHEAFHEELRPQAEERIKTALVLREIARKENITVEQGDLDREVEKMVDQFLSNTPEDEREERANSMRGFMQSEEMLNQLRDDLFSRKLSDRLLEMATGVSQTPAAEDLDLKVEAELPGSSTETPYAESTERAEPVAEAAAPAENVTATEAAPAAKKSRAKKAKAEAETEQAE
ncbi:MAG TPA: trigger factor [Chloroflexia bacterium]|nr:trigger factor [Chloroflexia bacterium]